MIENKVIIVYKIQDPGSLLRRVQFTFDEYIIAISRAFTLCAKVGKGFHGQAISK